MTMEKRIISRTMTVILVGLLGLAGCVKESKVARFPEPSPVAKPVLPPETRSSLPSELPLTQIAPKPSEIKESFTKERLYSLSYREAEVRDVLLAFSKESDLNIIFEPDVMGKVTVDLKKVTLSRALDSLLRPLNFDYKHEGRFIHVFKPKMETRIFGLNYLTVVRKGESAVSGTGGSTSSTTTVSGGTASSQGGAAVLSRVESKDTADLWIDIEGKDEKGGIRPLLSKEGRMAVNKLSSSLIVTDYPDNLRSIEKFLQRIERVIHRQVLIEAKVLEVSLNDQFQLGVDWRFLPQMTNMGFGWTGRQGLSGTAGTIPSVWSMPGATTGLQLGLTTLTFDSMIDALSQQGRVDIVATPRVSTLNNQKAIMKAATEDVYFEVNITTSATGNIITANPRYITIGVVLDVTPQIDGDGNIIMDIQPTVTEELGRRAFDISQGVKQEAPIVAVRQAQTVARVRDGQTIVIAGLIRERKRAAQTGVPGLMEIPLLGWVFRNTQETKEKSELVILITPTILNEREIVDFVQDDLKRARGFQNEKKLD